jgi:hypothetical protein
MQTLCNSELVWLYDSTLENSQLINEPLCLPDGFENFKLSLIDYDPTVNMPKLSGFRPYPHCFDFCYVEAASCYFLEVNSKNILELFNSATILFVDMSAGHLYAARVLRFFSSLEQTHHFKYIKNFLVLYPNNLDDN